MRKYAQGRNGGRTGRNGNIPLFCLLLVTGFLISLASAAQNPTVTGTVQDANGQPVVGVSVVEKGTKKGTQTDANGRFTISASPKATIIFSHAGFAEQEIPVAGQTSFVIRMQESAKALDEAVFIGYQKLRKNDLTGAVSSVKAKELNIGSPTLSQALVGKVAGVQVAQVSGAPYSGAKIRVRGVNSVNASSEPLYVIDGYAVGGNVSSGPGNTTNNTNGYTPNTAGNDVFINPEDIESIEILKDAASAAIYGSRASGGVILITTKRGSKGKGRLEYDYQAGVNQLAKKVKMLNADQFAQLFIDGRNGAYHDILIAKGITWNDAFYSDDNATRVAKAGSSNSASVVILKSLYDFPGQKMIKPQYNTDWQDALYRNAFNQRHNLSFSGGSENTRYLISGGYQDQDGIITATFQKRINLRANIDADLTKKLKVSSSVFVTNFMNREVEEGRFNQGPILGALVYMPIFAEYNPDGSLQLGKAAEQTDGYSYNFQGIENPVALAQRVNITRRATRATYNASATYEIIPKLYAKANFGAQTYSEKYEYYYPTNLSSGTNPPGSAAAIAAANAAAQTTSMLDKLAEFTLNYQKQFGEHNLNLLAGYTAQETTSDIVAVGANGFSNDQVPEITARGANAANFYILSNTGKSAVTLVSYLARAIYSYKNRYFLTGSFRTDGSSRFGPQSRFGSFPSVSAGWNLSNESFYNEWLGAGSTIKLRASWGLTGNNNIGNYKYEQSFTTPGGVVYGPGTISTATWTNGLTDPRLGWESTSQYNFGVDLSLLHNRLSLFVNYYRSKSYNLLFNQPISAVSNTGAVNGNLTNPISVLTNLHNADIRNNGIDVQVDARIIQGKDFGLNFSGNITANRNKVVSLGGASTIYVAGAERSYITHVTQEGQPIGMFYGIKVAGMVRQSDMANIKADDAALLSNNTFPVGYKLKGPARSTYSSTPLNPGDLYFQDMNGDGLINEADKGVIGTPYPKFTYGFNLSMNYKELDFSASFNGSNGNQVIDGQDYYIKNMEGSGNNYAVVANRYRSEAEPGDGKIYRASRAGTQSNSTRLSDFYIQDGSFFRCTNMTIGYNINRKFLLQKLSISSLRVFAGVDNAFTITKYLGYNPEVDYNNGSNLTPGVDYGKYPLVKAFNIGAKVQF
ncbi:MAG: TonB-dependent receptor [Bacteroidetes bacterium]|nr:TonB-dependent receptor [Bacteroidota bacterium]